jgi:hypothetical protein
MALVRLEVRAAKMAEQVHTKRSDSPQNSSPPGGTAKVENSDGQDSGDGKDKNLYQEWITTLRKLEGKAE